MSRVKLERKTDWLLRPATGQDRERILSFLRQNIWKQKEAEAVYAWKYEHNPQGDPLIYVGVTPGDEVIACGVFMPWKLAAGHHQVLATQWVDLVVAPAYRGQEIASKILQAGLDGSRTRGARVCFAFPNRNSLPVHKQNNACFLGQIIRLTRPLRTEYLVERFVKHRGLARVASLAANMALAVGSLESWYVNRRGFRLERMGQCDSGLDGLWRDYGACQGNRLMAERTAAYLSWKHLAAPNSPREIYAARRNDRLCGYVVLESSGEGVGYIVDILALDRPAARYLIVSAIRHFRARGMNSVMFVALEQHPCCRDFKRFGFLQRPETKHFCLYPLEPTPQTEPSLLDPRNWCVTIGDCDVERLGAAGTAGQPSAAVS